MGKSEINGGIAHRHSVGVFMTLIPQSSKQQLLSDKFSNVCRKNKISLYILHSSLVIFRYLNALLLYSI